jgi:hypothetical protein
MLLTTPVVMTLQSVSVWRSVAITVVLCVNECGALCRTHQVVCATCMHAHMQSTMSSFVLLGPGQPIPILPSLANVASACAAALQSTEAAPSTRLVSLLQVSLCAVSLAQCSQQVALPF